MNFKNWKIDVFIKKMKYCSFCDSNSDHIEEHSIGENHLEKSDRTHKNSKFYISSLLDFHRKKKRIETSRALSIYFFSLKLNKIY